MNTKIRLRDCNLFRFVCFVLIPLIVLIYCGVKPKSYYTGIVIMIGIYIILCASLNLVNGFSGMFSMGHAAFMAIGAYMAAFFTLAPQVKENQCPGLPDWLINTQIPLPPALLIGGIAAAIVAVLIGFPVVRTKGHYLSVVTLALIVVVRAVIDNQGDITHGSRGLTGLPNRSTVALVYIVVVITLFVLYRITHSDYGRGLIAMRDDPVAAQTLGINLVKKKISCFAISAFFAGIGGGLWGHFVTTISGSNFYFSKSFDIVEMSVIGGMFSLSGSIPGAMFFSIVPEFLAPLENGFRIGGVQLPMMFGLSNIIMAVLLILLIIFRRQGIMGNSEIILDTWFSKDTYLAPFRKNEYQRLAAAFRRKSS
ncbi:MAG: branched-chain amino acid ABC transporter permease [Eubacterium sp.]|nr:branched-chain amino acid ABC transporter permease [Eubacterium sp.]